MSHNDDVLQKKKKFGWSEFFLSHIFVKKKWVER